METVLDVFNSDAFGVIALTDSINKVPFAPGRAGQLIDWAEEGVPVDTIEFEQKGDVLTLVNPTPRGGPGEVREKVKATADVMKIPHYEINGGVNAAEVQGVRPFGGGGGMLQTVQDAVNKVQTVHAMDLDATLEYQRMGAVKGIILNGDGSTYLNLFTKFAVTPQTEVGFNLAAGTGGATRGICTAVVRTIAKSLGGQPYTGVYGLCSDSYWDALIKNAEVRESYLAQQEASQLRDGVAYETLRFGGITFENYRGGVGAEEATSFIETDKAYFFPVGVSRLFRTVYAPADYMETVNTIGLPRYSKQFPWANGKGVSLDSQMNALSYCTRPRALVKGKLAA